MKYDRLIIENQRKQIELLEKVVEKQANLIKKLESTLEKIITLKMPL